MNYKEEIIKTVKNIENEKYLEFIYNFILSFKKKWGF